MTNSRTHNFWHPSENHYHIYDYTQHQPPDNAPMFVNNYLFKAKDTKGGSNLEQTTQNQFTHEN